MVDIQVSEETTNRLHTILSTIGKADEKVLKPALNRGLTAGKTAFNKQIKTVYNVTPAVISEYSTLGFKKVEMRSDGLIGSIEYSGKVIPLYKFDVTPELPTYGKKPITVSVKNGKSGVSKHKFVAQMESGHLGVFERVGDSNLPIEEKYGPSVPKMAKNTVVLQVVEDRVNEIVNKRIEHEIDRILSGGS
jgi:hypothetical protein